MWGIAVLPLLFLLASADEEAPRIDCFPEPDSTQELCEKRGCKWEKTVKTGGPYCFFANNTGYLLDDGWSKETASLTKRTDYKNPYYPNVDKLHVAVKTLGSTLNIKITDPNHERYEVPLPFPRSFSNSSSKFDVTFSRGGPSNTFSFTVTRGTTKIWDTSIGGLLYGDQYIQIATYLPTSNIYGFGEHIHKRIKHNMDRYTTWPMFTRDIGPDSGSELSTTPLYGVHPFYMGIEDDGSAHGVFILNSNAQEATLGPGPHLVYRTIGGILDIYFFPGPTPEEVVKQYHAFIGTPVFPAYWALGFQLCRWGYVTLENMTAAVQRTQDAGVPLEIVIADIDYMERFKDFTLSWTELKPYVDKLHKQGLHVTLMTDPAIQVNYATFERAMNSGARFIEWPDETFIDHSISDLYPLLKNTTIMPGNVWPDNNTAMADFLEETNKTKNWWINEFQLFRNKTGMDTIWIDMNEPSNFDTDPKFESVTPARAVDVNYRLKCPANGTNSGYDDPKYPTHAKWAFGKDNWLFSKTLCMIGRTGGGKYRFYDTHSIWGATMAMATYEAQKMFGNRGAIVSRSTYPSAGHYVGHWLGDNTARWEDLQTSVIGAQEFNMFGMTYTGSDICGFFGETNEELCVRWHQMGAFHTYSRNHNAEGYSSQDPGMWKSVALAAKKSLLFKYNHLPYLYTLMYEASVNGGTVIRPVFFEFPKDSGTYNIGYQFMWGSGMMITPVVHQGAVDVTAYIPQDATWYHMREDMYGFKLNRNMWQTFSAGWDEVIPVFARGGTIIAKQKAATVIRDMRNNSFELLIATGPAGQGSSTDGVATGNLYWDDGESYLDTKNFYYMSFHYDLTGSSARLYSKVTIKPTSATSLPKLSKIDIFNYPCNPGLQAVKLGGTAVPVTTVYSEYNCLSINFTQQIDLVNGIDISWDSCRSPTTPSRTTGKPATSATQPSPTGNPASTTQQPTETPTANPTTTSSASSIGYAALLVLPLLY